MSYVSSNYINVNDSFSYSLDQFNSNPFSESGIVFDRYSASKSDLSLVRWEKYYDNAIINKTSSQLTINLCDHSKQILDQYC